MALPIDVIPDFTPSSATPTMPSSSPSSCAAWSAAPTWKPPDGAPARQRRRLPPRSADSPGSPTRASALSFLTDIPCAHRPSSLSELIDKRRRCSPT
ncbi:hypothetical protein [Nonomuraea sediminis]|uniref:hypothetical protein n=1 Tax=Nonomuraea sediminis TaxID=2835864 RepID=UPI00202A606D|nr:hypothetical protein [Nonomuraea sediminis]